MKTVWERADTASIRFDTQSLQPDSRQTIFAFRQINQMLWKQIAEEVQATLP